MPYVPDWEPLAYALKHVLALSSNEQEAKADICNAVADKKIAIRILVDESDRDVGGETLSAPQIAVPPRLSPEDFDWERSRPLTPWETGPNSVVELYFPTWNWKPRKIALLELSTADVASVLCGGTSSIPTEGVRRGVTRTRAPDGDRNQTLAADSVCRVGRALFGDNWIGSLTNRQRWLIDHYVEGRQQLSSIRPGHITYTGPGGPVLPVNDPALRAEAEAACDRRDWMNEQYDRVYDWLESHGLNIEDGSLDTDHFDRAFASDFPNETATGAKLSGGSSPKSPAEVPNAARPGAPTSSPAAAVGTVTGYQAPDDLAPKASGDAATLLSPGPKGGETKAAATAWEIAAEILADDKCRPPRGHSRLTAVARKVQSLLKERRGQARELDTITKYIRGGLRAWEAANPDK